MKPRRSAATLVLLLAACTSRSPTAAPLVPSVASPAALTAKPLSLPGVTGTASLDYIVYEPGNERVWVPVGNTGSVDVLDIANARFDVVNGFKTAEREMRGKKRVMGPSAVTVGEGVVYVGNRATAEVCVVEATSLKLGQCLTLPQSTDGVAYVASTKEVWVTTPRDHSLTVLDASDPRSLKPKVVVKLDGQSEGYAVDEGRGRFFTNLEDKDRTVVVNVKTHRPEAVWKPECGEAGPRGLAIDPARDFVFVACTDHVQVLDAGHGGALLGRLDTGPGLDNIDYLAAKGVLYAAAGGSARLTVAKIDEGGHFAVAGTASTAEGARNAVADSKGNAYVADSANGRLLVFPFAP